MPATNPVLRRTREWEIDSYGLRLAPKKYTGRAHQVDPIPFLAQQISSTAELTTADISRDVELAFAQERFHEGIIEAAKGTLFNLENQHRIRFAKNVDTSFPPYALPGPAVTTIGATIAFKPFKMVQRGNITYLAADTKLYQVTTGAVTLDTTFGQPISDLYVFGGFLIIGQGDANVYQYRASDTSAGAFTSAAAGNFARYFTATIDQLFRAWRPNQIASADGPAGTWAVYDAGDSSYNVTSLGALDQAIIVGKEDGPYSFDTDLTAQPVIPELRLQTDAQVGKAAATFNRDYYVSSRFGIVRIRPGEGLKNVGLDALADPQLPNNDPRPAAFASDGRFMYAIVAPAGTAGVYIWKRDTNDAWHNFLWRSDLGGASLEAADLLFVTNKIAATAKNAVVFAYQPSAGNWQLAYANWSPLADPSKDTAYVFESVAGRCSFRTLDYIASLLTVPKYSDRIKDIASNLNTATRTVGYAAWLDDETASRALKTFELSPTDEYNFNEPLNYHRVSLDVALVSEAASAPKLRAFHLSAALLPRVVRKHTCHFLAATATPNLTGGRSSARAGATYADVIKKLRSLRATQASVNCVDERGRKFKAYLTDIAEWEAEPRDALEGPPVAVLTCVLKEVAADDS